MQLNERRINHIKIVVIHGQTHKGSTYNITKLFLENFSDENTEIIEFFYVKRYATFLHWLF